MVPFRSFALRQISNERRKDRLRKFTNSSNGKLERDLTAVGAHPRFFEAFAQNCRTTGGQVFREPLLVTSSETRRYNQLRQTPSHRVVTGVTEHGLSRWIDVDDLTLCVYRYYAIEGRFE